MLHCNETARHSSRALGRRRQPGRRRTSARHDLRPPRQQARPSARARPARPPWARTVVRLRPRTGRGRADAGLADLLRAGPALCPALEPRKPFLGRRASGPRHRTSRGDAAEPRRAGRRAPRLCRYVPFRSGLCRLGRPPRPGGLRGAGAHQPPWRPPRGTRARGGGGAARRQETPIRGGDRQPVPRRPARPARRRGARHGPGMGRRIGAHAARGPRRPARRRTRPDRAGARNHGRERPRRGREFPDGRQPHRRACHHWPLHRRR
jgi:hypothetical protein